MATTTPNSFIAQLRDEAPDAWERWNRCYRPWLLDWTTQHLHFQPFDAEEIVQQVMADLLLEFRKQRAGVRAVFEHNGRTGAFRNWLRTLTHHRALAFARSQRLRQSVPNAEERLAQLNDPHSGLSDLWNQQHEQQVIHQAWEVVQHEFKDKVWRPVGEILFKARRASEVAAEFAIPLRTLFSHSRAIKDRLRELLEGMID